MIAVLLLMAPFGAAATPTISGEGLAPDLPELARRMHFTNVTAAAGVELTHGSMMMPMPMPGHMISGGVACGDYDGDGWPDLYVVGGDTGSNALYRNQGDGTFVDVAVAAGVDRPGTMSCGPTFADWDGDGLLDLFVGGVTMTTPKLYRNQGDGTFADVTMAAGVNIMSDTWSASFGDPDSDGDLDMLLTHWAHMAMSPPPEQHLWQNNGDGTFTALADSVVGLTGYRIAPMYVDYSFVGNFADINNDGWTDILQVSDFLTSQVYLNDGDGTFTRSTDPAVIAEDNGMGSAVADYDNDGDLDWFVTSIYDSTGTKSGNRLYRNTGSGTFEDVTTFAGVRKGYWGWGASFADFNNDGWLDIYHVNGFNMDMSGGPPPQQWADNPARLFIANGDGTFREMSKALHADDTGQGRGIACVDFDRDGDLDVFISNNQQKTVLLRNDGGNKSNWLAVKPAGPAPNIEEIGARVTVTIGSSVQMREIRCGNNFVSQDPAEAHFGLGGATVVDQLDVAWTDGTTTTMNNVPANQFLVVTKTQPAARGASAAQQQPVAGGVTLLGAAPNPARGSTSIRFSLANTSPATVRIFDTAGRAVRTLVDGVRPGGRQSVSWNGRDDAGRTVGAGVYWYEVRTAERRASGKILLLR